MMDADNNQDINQDINQHDEEESCTSENEIDVSQPSTPARRLSNVEIKKNTQNNQGSTISKETQNLKIIKKLLVIIAIKYMYVPEAVLQIYQNI
jgi:chromatin remodeling complex protein RSC6